MSVNIMKNMYLSSKKAVPFIRRKRDRSLYITSNEVTKDENRNPHLRPARRCRRSRLSFLRSRQNAAPVKAHSRDVKRPSEHSGPSTLPVGRKLPAERIEPLAPGNCARDRLQDLLSQKGASTLRAKALGLIRLHPTVEAVYSPCVIYSTRVSTKVLQKRYPFVFGA
jgi:hypothetical protein